MKKMRYYNNNVGLNKDAVSLVLATAFDLCKKDKSIKTVIFLICNKRTDGEIKLIFDKKTSKQLYKGAITKDNIHLKIETKRTIYDYTDKNIIVALGIDSKDLFKYDSYQNTVAIIAHQWGPTGVKEWAQAWGAINLYTGKPILKNDVSNPIVREAFKELHKSINVLTGIGYPTDKEKCKTFIRALFKYDYTLNSNEIFSYLVTELRWQSRHAKDVVKLIDKINSSGYFQGGEKKDLKKYIDRWETKANQ